MRKWSGYLWKLGWLVGLIILTIIVFNIENQIQRHVADTFDATYMYWSKPIIALIYGLYISLILVRKWTINLNPSLFWCVFIPNIVLAFAVPLWSFVLKIEIPSNNIAITIYTWLNRMYTSNLFGIIAGSSLILSIFNCATKSRAHK
ncbi:hypothetical protein M3649_09135 [Ureibacillus chungkukjangi]|uniref:hypothetical protein n=1 Tax=Ureibacillus chungkukjangi TaxID=1202712 RepID=UPI00203BD8C4|nr:hypothetical protein [Ureibacillus chungkukjangi]MCM3388296.1 hypothetical protein [Ureibacillus chungkukjangi]